MRGEQSERLQKLLARAGIASRRKAEAMITEGRVVVDGRVVTELGTKVDPRRSRVLVDGMPLETERPVYYLLHKPASVVTTMDDPEGRASVGDLVKDVPERVFPVGRLDYDAEGVLLVTNDGDLAHRLTHPRFGVRRTYDAKVRGVPSEASLDRLRDGLTLEDGDIRPLFVEVVGRAQRNTWVRVGLTEGRHHIVKRMMEAVGHPVQRLRRIEYGGLMLDDLPRAGLRPLGAKEVAALRAQADVGAPPDSPPTLEIGQHVRGTGGVGRRGDRPAGETSKQRNQTKRKAPGRRTGSRPANGPRRGGARKGRT